MCEMTPETPGRSRRRSAARSCQLLLVAAAVGSWACQSRVRGSRETARLEAREATAVAWVNALGGGPGEDEPLRQLTAGALVYRTTGETDHASCEGRVSSEAAAFTAWLSCVRAKPYLRELSATLGAYHDALRADSVRNALGLSTARDHLSHVTRPRGMGRPARESGLSCCFGCSTPTPVPARRGWRRRTSHRDRRLPRPRGGLRGFR